MPDRSGRCRGALALLFLLLVVGVVPSAAFGQQGDTKGSPFTDVRWDDDGATHVEYDGAWHVLHSIAGRDPQALITWTNEVWQEDGHKRFSEDLVELLQRMEILNDGDALEVSLEMTRESDGARVVVDAAELSLRNRQTILQKRRAREREAQREQQPRQSVVLQPDVMQSDLTHAEALIFEQWSYIDARDADRGAGRAAIRSAFEALRTRAERPMARKLFAQKLQAIIAMTIDGHAGIGEFRGLLSDEYPAMLLQHVGAGRVVAYRPDRTALLDDEHPYVVAIEGVALAEWLKRVRPFVVDGSDAAVHDRSLGLLRSLTAFADTAFDGTDGVQVQLRNADASSEATVTVALSGRRPTYGSWPRSVAVDVPDDVLYVRLASFSGSDALERVTSALAAAREQNTTRMILDVRGNGGGNRRALLALLPSLLNDDAHVFNVARPLRACADMEEEMLGRGLRPLDDATLTDAERKAAHACLATFEPTWRGDDALFGPWHVGVVARAAEEDRYRGAVVVLMDDSCFSATDIFLGALKGLPNVTLMGSASGGGSGSSERYGLSGSRLTLRLSRMASYRSDGRLYDGVGVAPDVELWPSPADLVGRDDSVLRAAIELLESDR